MSSFLIVTRIPYEEPHHLNLVVATGNSSVQTEFEIYTNASDLSDVSAALVGFPKRDDDSFTWELGSENERDRFAFYFRLRVFQLSALGRCGLEIRVNNNEKPPQQLIAEFCIEAFPADLDRLGAMLDTFCRLESPKVEWRVHPEG